MTMHLERGLTTLNTRKPKKKTKFTQKQIEKWSVEMRKHNKQMRRINCHHMQMTLDDYVDYIHGRYKRKTPERAVTTPWHDSGVYRREAELDKAPSLRTEQSFSPCTKKEVMHYTGERKLVGIAMMHKSNLVPVFADDDDKTGQKQATEYAQMRRN